jgi:carbon-monoxide dehydrogenase small subunit
MMNVTFTINNVKRSFELPADMKLLELLRREGYLSVKKGCGTGECGACTVLINGKAFKSCVMFAAQCAGKSVLTSEGLGTPTEPHPIQDAFVEVGAVQCGFCIPGMILSTKALLDSIPDRIPSEEEIKEALDGNLCRCTGYVKQIDAVKLAAQKLQGGGE